MKILHTADWHIGKRLERFPRLAEQEAVLAEIVEITHREDPDLVLVAGDLFDTFNPGSDAQELLYRTLRTLSGDGERAVVAIAGNHDSPDRVTAPEVLARTHGILLIGDPEGVFPPFSSGAVSCVSSEAGFVELAVDRPATAGVPVRVLTVPYANEQRLKRALALSDSVSVDSQDDEAAALQALLAERWKDVAERRCGPGGVNLMAAHLLFAADPTVPPEEPEGERPIGYVGGAPALATTIVPPQVQYAACGHLHRAHAVSGPVPLHYSGSPLAYSFSEAGQDKSVTIVEVDARGSLGEEPEIRRVPLTRGRPLVRHTADSVEDALSWLGEHGDALVELSVTLDDYLSGTDRRRLHDRHDGIVTIVPLARRGDAVDDGSVDFIDPRGDMKELFVRFFRDRHGTEPSDEVMSLLSEVLSQEDQA